MPQSVTCSGSPRTGVLSDWRKRVLREKDRLRKKKERRKKDRPLGGGALPRGCKGALSNGMMKVTKPKQTKEKDAVRKYTIHRAPGTFLTFTHREHLAREWNKRIKNGPHPTMRSFAKEMGIPAATWQREFNRGKTAETVRDPRRPNRWTYGEYDAGKAQDEINRNAANKGCPMAVTNILAEKFAHLVKVRKLSPYDAVRRMEEDEELKGKRIPKASTWYKHIRHGDIPVHYGDTPYHPDRERRKGPKPHEAKTVPGRLQLSDRPREANERLEPGHWEMDTVVSCINGVGGLLVLIDRFTREYRIELVREISQRAIIKALKRMRKKKLLSNARSVTTDNGCEFLDPEKIKAVLGCEVYYTRAYASYEKGSVENCNRIVRRWYPKGTDFGLCTRRDIRALERTINGIHRLSLNGMTATQFAAQHAPAA